MHRDHRLYLDDILDAIRQIMFYVENQDEDAFAADRKTQNAVIRNMKIIGEAAGCVIRGSGGIMAQTCINTDDRKRLLPYPVSSGKLAYQPCTLSTNVKLPLFPSRPYGHS